MMMEIDILAFGAAKEILGGASATLRAGEAVTAETIRVMLVQQYPRLELLKSFMIAVNGEYADAGTIIKQGDEVAIIPPVSGG